MNEAKPPLPEIKPVAVFLDQGKVITQEFVSRDGHTSATEGIRSTGEGRQAPNSSLSCHRDPALGDSSQESSAQVRLERRRNVRASFLAQVQT